MAFDHNDHYHRVILAALPGEAQRVLDVGCGTGEFARLLSAHGLDVDAIDRFSPVIDEARTAGCPGPGRISYRVADAGIDPLPPATYDAVTCVASLHHMPFSVVATLARSLRPGGRLIVIGLYRNAWSDYPVDAVAIPAHHAISWYRDFRARRQRDPAPTASVPPLRDPELTIAQMTEQAATLIPGARFRRLLYWRYLMVWEKPTTG